MPRRYLQRKQPNTVKKSNNNNASTHEFYLLEKLYEAMRNDTYRGKGASTEREFYLLERLYEAIRNDRIRNTK